MSNIEFLVRHGESGFLPDEDPIINIPEKRFEPLHRAMIMLPGAFPSKQMLALIYGELHTMDSDFHVNDLTDRECEALFRDLGFLAAATVHGTSRNPEGVVCLPSKIAVPLCALAERLGVYPTLPYFSYALHNWLRPLPDEPLSLVNSRVIRHFIPDMDEEWFILIHVAIEQAAVKAMCAIKAICEDCIQYKNCAKPENIIIRVGGNLSDITLTLRQMISLFREMPRCCSPQRYFINTRPQIMPFMNVVYNGVERYGERPQSFVAGETGAQSCIAPALDAFFGIKHEPTHGHDFIREMRNYMLPRHRTVIEEIEKNTSMEDFFASFSDNWCKNQWNNAVEQLWRFRDLHLDFAGRYVFTKVLNQRADLVQGTGGTPAEIWLAQLRDETNRALIH